MSRSWTSFLRCQPSLAKADALLTVLQTARKVVTERREKAEVNRLDMLSRLFSIQKEHPERFDDFDVLCVTTQTIFGGSDTTSIAIRAILYFLIRNERCYGILLNELDSAYVSGALSDMSTFAEAQKLPYLQACPSLGTQHQRWVPKGGAVIAGQFLPEKVRHAGLDVLFC